MIALAAIAIVGSAALVSAGLVTLAMRSGTRSMIASPQRVLPSLPAPYDPPSIPAEPRETPSTGSVAITARPQPVAAPREQRPTEVRSGNVIATSRVRPIAHRTVPVTPAVRVAPVANARPASCADRCHGDMDCLMQCSVGH